MGLQANRACGFPLNLWGFEVQTDGVLPIAAVNRPLQRIWPFVVKMEFWSQLRS
jgi:hypothetical protein